MWPFKNEPKTESKENFQVVSLRLNDLSLMYHDVLLRIDRMERQIAALRTKYYRDYDKDHPEETRDKQTEKVDKFISGSPLERIGIG